ncbi:PA4780 family RIO1-like protein kinase [Litorivivens sp.]|uniref:PA4780 family RIO1-like protein kinase n=4 Tax=Litorivivens sp. TaxID=2020868 RepID=UPI00356143BC
MKIPKRLIPLLEDGLIDTVERQLLSGKEATVYVVRCGEELRCAKVYKDVAQRSFKQAVEYREGRKDRNSRRSRAMEKGSRYGRRELEDSWHNAEVNALYRLAAAEVRVPKPYGCFDGVLLMELVTDEDGDVAPRLNDITLTPELAREGHGLMMGYVVRMLCAGLVHGDLSEFNVLMDGSGPVIIDLPQAVDAAGNNHAPTLFMRDVNNMTRYYGQFAPELLATDFANEIWALYEAGDLSPESPLTGQFEQELHSADVNAVLGEIAAAYEEEQERLERINGDAAE